jgi:DNA-binding CsgD family transcriptional regulator
MWKTVALYGVALAIGVFLLHWFDYLAQMRSHRREAFIFLVSIGFLALGLAIGARVFGGRPASFDGNPDAQAALGLSRRELEVLQEMAAGKSNKEIGKDLAVSPNTVKTHAAKLYEKLGARRRTEAISKARTLGLIR